ncbi:transporter [Sphingomonas hankyongi]|uniref:Transporter n=1 Tax=Sphingomonas hankyongi TaxID=2908209 RepID=A0ABT0S0Y8_9SPHN|nr:transporter [Sphingomonas hankyongi]MCL6729313.1 transporter [Sphingomonas hankyongi]
MGDRFSSAAWAQLSTGTALLFLAQSAGGQSIEPRAYSPAPVGTNFVIAAYSESHGAIPVDPALPLSDIDLKVRAILLAYARSFALYGKSAKFDVILPVADLNGTATFHGEPVERKVDGISDPLMRVTVLFHGAPAMNAAQFRSYRQDLLLGASVQISVPVGQYDEGRLLNLGGNRWAIKPELGAAKSWGRWTVEAAGGATFYTANTDFFGGHKRTQKPIYSAQSHLIYNLSPGAWIAANLSWFGGGRTSIDGIADNNLQRNWRARHRRCATKSPNLFQGQCEHRGFHAHRQ